MWGPPAFFGPMTMRYLAGIRRRLGYAAGLLTICLTGAFTLTTTAAPNPEADSLRRLLRAETRDTSRVLLYKELSFAQRNSRPDLALQSAQAGLRLARRIGFRRGEAACLNNQGLAYWLMGNLPLGLTSFLDALKINEQIGNRRGLASNLSNIGNIYAEQGDEKASLRYTFRALAIQQALPDEAGVTLQLLNIGASYQQLRRPDSALYFTHLGYEKARRRADDENLGIALTNLGDIAATLHQPVAAMDYYRRAAPHLHAAGYDDGLCVIYLSLAELFGVRNQPDSTLRYARLSLVTARRGGFNKHVLDAGNLLTAYFKRRHRPDSAFHYLELATTAKDSLYSQEKLQHVQQLFFAENLRQQELRAATERARETRRYNLQLLGIAIFILTFFMGVVLLSRRGHSRAVEWLGIVALLIVFEFISILTEPYIQGLTNNSPVLMLLTMVALAAGLAPVHHRIEAGVQRWLTRRHASGHA